MNNHTPSSESQRLQGRWPAGLAAGFPSVPHTGTGQVQPATPCRELPVFTIYPKDLGPRGNSDIRSFVTATPSRGWCRVFGVGLQAGMRGNSPDPHPGTAQVTCLCLVGLVFQHPPGQIARKYSSCSTIFLDDSTVSQPNLKYTIKWWVCGHLGFPVHLCRSFTWVWHGGGWGTIGLGAGSTEHAGHLSEQVLLVFTMWGNSKSPLQSASGLEGYNTGNNF